jgi:phosphoribosyl 1,2-cyclic phosphodiesterase
MRKPELSHPQSQKLEEENTLTDSHLGEFVVHFWGVRGLIATPSSENSRYGGNTSCVEIRVGSKRLIFDGGTGLRILGKNWLSESQPLEGHLFFTNSQSNRIQGFPFFAPAFLSKNSFHIYGIAASNGASIKQCLCDQMLQPHFPYPLQVMQSELQFYNVIAGKEILLGDILVRTALINHTQKSIGYRVSWQSYNIAYVTDVQANLDEFDKEKITQLIQGVDLLITNSPYILSAEDSYQKSDLNLQTVIDLAHACEVKRLVISHHHPDDHDIILDDMQNSIQSVFAKAIVAHEGLVLPLLT